MSEALGRYNYAGIILQYYQDIVAPLLCRVSDRVLDQVYGNNKWNYVESIMESYPFWDTIQDSYKVDDKLTMDATAICYLMFPYKIEITEGLMTSIQAVFGLNEKQRKSIHYVNKIRNDVAHNVPNGTDLDGHLEMEAFEANIKALSIFDVTLKQKTQKFIDEVNGKEKENVQTSTKEQKEEMLMNNLAIQTQQERQEYSFLYKYKDLEWMNAPIGLRLDEAPWSRDFDDLDQLPWPELEKNELPPIPEKVMEPLFDKEELKDIAHEAQKQALRATKEISKGLSKGFKAFKKYMDSK